MNKLRYMVRSSIEPKTAFFIAMTEVYFKKATYDYRVLKPIIFEMLETILGDRIHSKSRVLVKPNFLSPAKPDKAILTHPLGVRAAVE